MARQIKVFFMTASATMRGLYTRQLAGSNLELIFIDSIDFARHRAARIRPDFFIADLEDVSRETIESCRKFIRAYPEIRVVLLCPVGDAEWMKSATGTSLCLNKPATPAKVTAVLDDALIESIEKILAKITKEEEAARKHLDPITGLDNFDHFKETLSKLMRGDGPETQVGLVTGWIDAFAELVVAHDIDERTRFFRRLGEAVRKVFLSDGHPASATCDENGIFRIVIAGLEPKRTWEMLNTLQAAIDSPAGEPEHQSLALRLREKKPWSPPVGPAFTISAVLRTTVAGVGAINLPERLLWALDTAVKPEMREKLFWQDDTLERLLGLAP